MSDWKENALCEGIDPTVFFDQYEEMPETRPEVDDLCKDCPVQKQCIMAGAHGKETGVWGGIYLLRGKPSREFNNHRKNDNWAATWIAMLMDK